MSISKSFDQQWRLNDATGCWEWVRGRVRNTYGVLSVDNKQILAHRFSYEKVFGPIRKDLCVLHRCDNPPCVNPDHLFLGTQQDNMRDRDRKGRRAPTHGTRLTPIDAERIRDMRRCGVKLKNIAAHFGIGTSHASYISSGKAWRVS